MAESKISEKKCGHYFVRNNFSKRLDQIQNVSSTDLSFGLWPGESFYVRLSSLGLYTSSGRTRVAIVGLKSNNSSVTIDEIDSKSGYIILRNIDSSNIVALSAVTLSGAILELTEDDLIVD